LKQFLTTDRLGAILLLLIGCGTIIQGRRYDVGDLTRMGPGYMPVVLGCGMTALGFILVFVARNSEQNERPEWPDLRATICILAGVIVFVVFGRYLGLLPAAFTSTFVAAMGHRANSFRDSALLGGGVMVAAAVIFHWGLKMQFPLLNWGS